MDNALHDKELFQQIAAGDENAFRDIFHSYNGRLFHTILKIVKSKPEAEEIIQELFLKLWLRRESLNTIESPGAWLFTIASNLSLDALRKQARQHVLELSDTTEDTDPEPAHLLELREVKSLIDEAVSQLPPSRRQVFILSRREGKSRGEIAQDLNLSESTVKNQLTSALRFVQEYLQKKGDIYLPAFLVLFIR